MARVIQGIKFTKTGLRKRSAKLRKRRRKTLTKGYPKEPRTPYWFILLKKSVQRDVDKKVRSEKQTVKLILRGLKVSLQNKRGVMRPF
jgi:hypothetical protein